MARECDVVVLGMGPGGEEVAGRLAEAGLDVVGVEAELLGGECPYWACVPSKMMVRAGDLLAEARRVPGMAGTTRVEPDFAPVHARIRDEATADWDDAAAVERFTAKGGRFVRGRGRYTGQGRVEVDAAAGAETFAARVGVVLATGSAPAAPPVPGLDQVPYWTNREAVSAAEAPESLLVLGGGAVGVELAQSYARFGTRVTLVEASERVVSAEEPEAGDLLLEVLRREGLTVLTGTRARAARYADGAFVLTLDGGEEVSAERLLVATGRRPRLDALDHAALGLGAEARRVEVDAHMRAAPGVWALGDLVGRGAFTHVAMYQADVAVRAVLAAAGRGEAGPGADYRALPHVTFTDPEIGSVGLTEAAARERGLTVRTGTARVPDGIRGWIHKAGNDGLIKLVEDAERGILVGATAAGPMGGEVLYGLAVAIRAAVPTATLRDMMFAFPTFHRSVLEALGDLAAD
ncbi:NAD(P)/FAD-dependent oxidoreductase [Streptomyces sp. WMMB303]|uniref:dihydrolipoyl dehydrogenase family protein n=1 Tax=unclassified Streptomyces TaxID=2593676 RepID=UPI0023EB2E5B|nr:NAD(P)/FAD-dependent oxidoreductase [Streptomyces sp. WMMB303]MDF4254196.1 NAD(P)/FAD-dependent oxidoreductase [Streptomyces sp. WMMB303]